MLTRRTTADVALAPRMALSMEGVERDRRLPDNSISRVQKDSDCRRHCSRCSGLLC